MEKKIAKWYRVAGIAENNEIIDKSLKLDKNPSISE